MKFGGAVANIFCHNPANFFAVGWAVAELFGIAREVRKIEVNILVAITYYVKDCFLLFTSGPKRTGFVW